MRIVVMGPSGSGKSLVGASLAAALRADFVDGDDLHSRANVAKMASGRPLDDADREPAQRPQQPGQRREEGGVRLKSELWRQRGEALA